MTTEPEAIPADVLELAEAIANRIGVTPTSESRPYVIRAAELAIMADRASRAPVDGAGWRPIETAPKDGTRILALEGDRHFDCWWRDFGYGEQCWMDEADTEPDPTHWMPLPAAPSTHPAPASPDAEMVEELESRAENLTKKLSDPAFRPTRAHIESCRNLVLRAVFALSKHGGDR